MLRATHPTLWIVPLLVTAACHAPAPVHLAAPNARGPYSGSVAAGDLVFVAGKIGEDRTSFATEVDSALTAVADELARHGLDLHDIVSVTVHLTEIARYADFNAAYAARMPAPFPARTCVAVTALPAGAQVEITATATRR